MEINQDYKQCVVFNQFNITILVVKNDIVRELNTKFDELSQYVKAGIDVAEINKLSIKITSILKTLLQEPHSRGFNTDNSTLRSLVDSSVFILEYFSKNLLQLGDFKKCIYDDFYQFIVGDTVKRLMYPDREQEMLFKLYRFHWLIKEGLLNRPHPNHEDLFSQEELERFFEGNRKDVIQSIINDVRRDGDLSVEDPMSDYDFRHLFQLRKKMANQNIEPTVETPVE